MKWNIIFEDILIQIFIFSKIDSWFFLNELIKYRMMILKKKIMNYI